MSDPPKENARLSRLAVSLLITGAMIACLVLLALWQTPPPFPPGGQSGTNGYPELLAAAAKLAHRTGDSDPMEPGELAASLERNRPALEMAHQALLKPCWVTFPALSDPKLQTLRLQQTSSLRDLARALASAAQQARATGRPDEGLRWGWDAVRLAEAARQDGVVVDHMVAASIHRIALVVLAGQVSALSREECSQWQEKLIASPWKQDDFQALWRREMAKARHQHGRLQMFLMTRTLRAHRQTIFDQMQKSDRIQLALRTILQTHLALRAYQLDHQQLPATLDPLVPEYIPQLPADPFSQGSLRYLPQGDSYSLYSVGENGTDDQDLESLGSEPGDLQLDIAP